MNSVDDKPVHYLTVSDLYNINNDVTNGNTWIRDVHLLNSAANRPSIVIFGQSQFPTLLDKAAALLHSLAYHHLFMDGNKRTAIRAVTLFLNQNGYKGTWDEAAQQEFVLEVAQGKKDIPQIARWLSRHVRPE